MSSLTPESAQEDLAFLRTLARSGDGVQGPFGEAYLAGGLCYGGQMLLSAAQTLGWLPSTPLVGLAIGAGPTVLFIPLLIIALSHARKVTPTGVVGRTIATVFSTIGMANLALAAVIASVALRQHSLTIWLIFPCAVFVLQGAAWFVAFSLRKRAWLGLVAAGWVICALFMAWFIDQTVWYITFGGIGMFACMVAPGLVMMRLARRAAG